MFKLLFDSIHILSNILFTQIHFYVVYTSVGICVLKSQQVARISTILIFNYNHKILSKIFNEIMRANLKVLPKCCHCAHMYMCFFIIVQ